MLQFSFKIILFLLLGLSAYSQNLEPQAFYFDNWDKNDSTNLAPIEENDFKQTKIIKGFQWYGNYGLINALNMNSMINGTINYFYEDNCDPNTDSLSYDEPVNDIRQPGVCHNMAGMQYEPTLELTEDEFYNYKTRDDDPSNPVFGFKTINGQILTDTADTNYSRLILRDTIASSTSPINVLKGITPNPRFMTFAGDNQMDGYQGQIWWLSINVNRIGTDQLQGGDTVLKVRIKYSTDDSTSDQIWFSSKPYNTHNDNDNLYGYSANGIQYRGKAKKEYEAFDTVLTITKGMILTDGEPITFSAKFLTDDGELTNPMFFKKDTTGTKIVDLDIEVDYYGNLDIGIDWVRIENIYTHKILRGEMDSLGRYYDGTAKYVEVYPIPNNDLFKYPSRSIYDRMQMVLDYTKDQEDLQFFRFYGQDLESSDYFWWIQQRYMNLVSNGLAAYRMVNSFSKHFYHYTKSEERFDGMKLGPHESSLNVPFQRIGNYKDRETMSLKGYTGHANHIYTDTLNSQYEIQAELLGDWVTYDSLKSISLVTAQDTIDYFEHLTGSHGTHNHLQGQFSETAVMKFMPKEKNKLLFQERPWWMLFFVGANIVAMDNDTVKGVNLTETDDLLFYSNELRIKTGEEFNLLTGLVNIIGAKGYFYDKEFSHELGSIDTTGAFNGIGRSERDCFQYGEDKLAYIKQPNIGADFYEYHSDIANYKEWITNDLHTRLGVASDRIYLGLQSLRLEMYKFHSFLDNNDEKLMNLRLQAWFAKDYRKWYIQDPKLDSANYLENFISMDSADWVVKKQKIKDLPFTDVEFVEVQENFDSTFFDITLLKDVNESIDSIFYIGILNRRTDPLIPYFEEGDEDISDIELQFYSTNEYDDFMESGGNGLTAEEWKYWYYKKQGVRDISIPFQYKTPNGDYNLLKITELDGEFKDSSGVDLVNDSLPRWLKEDRYDKVDTVIGQDRSLSVLLQPGESKILRVEILKPDVVEGFLDNYNQTKLISFPSTTDSTKVTYHLTYVKNELKPNDPTKEYKTVRYIKSKDIARNSQEENIEWDLTSQLQISRNFLENEDPMNPPPNYSDCNHPAIVVRDDSLGNTFAYIVYTCKDTLSVALDSARVVEAKINVSSNAIVSNTQIYKLNDNDIETQGTPVINASANGNFIAWTVKNEGLFVGFHPPEGTQPIAINSLENNATMPHCFGTDMLYPSVNTYSNISKGENNAAITWYQYCSLSDGNIFYSRLFYNSTTNNVEFMIPAHYEGKFNLNHDPLLKLVKVSSNIPDTTKPIIYRSLDDYSPYSPVSCSYNRFDNLHWIKQNSAISQPPGIHTITIAHKDSNNVPLKWTASEKRFYKFVGELSNVLIDGINTAQQHGYIIDSNDIYPAGNYNFNVNLSNSKIYQVPGYNQSILKETSSEIDYTKNGFREAGEGSMTHLAQAPQPNLSETAEIWKNRRVFETDETGALGNPIIKTSAKLFYKQTDYGYESEGYFGFKSGDNDLVFSPPFVDDKPEPIDISRTKEGMIQPCDLTIQFQPDTILTQYIYLEDNGTGDHDVSMGMIGNRDTNIKVFVQRLLDGAMAQLPIPLSTLEDQDKKLFYTIVDSTNDEFRFLYVSSDTNTKYAERAYIGGITHQDSTYYKSNGDKYHYIIDFNNGTNYKANETSKLQLVVYPNPTNGKVQVQSILPEEVKQYKNSHRSITVGVYSTTGKLLYEKIGNTGQIIEFDMSSSPTGSYIINASYEDDINKLKGIEKLIKE